MLQGHLSRVTYHRVNFGIRRKNRPAPLSLEAVSRERVHPGLFISTAFVNFQASQVRGGCNFVLGIQGIEFSEISLLYTSRWAAFNEELQ